MCVSSLTTLTNLMFEQALSSATKILHVHGDSASHVTPQEAKQEVFAIVSESRTKVVLYSHLTLSLTVSLITSTRPVES